jgi:hypothetical protein
MSCGYDAAVCDWQFLTSKKINLNFKDGFTKDVEEAVFSELIELEWHLGETCSTVYVCCRDIGACLMQLRVSHDDDDAALHTARLQAPRHSSYPETRGRYVESTALTLSMLNYLKKCPCLLCICPWYAESYDRDGRRDIRMISFSYSKGDQKSASFPSDMYN